MVIKILKKLNCTFLGQFRNIIRDDPCNRIVKKIFVRIRIYVKIYII